MKKIIQLITLLILIPLYIKAAAPNYTAAEKEWLKNNPKIKLAVMSYWSSDKYKKTNHRQIIELLNKYGKLNITPVTFDNWKDGYEKATLGKELNGIMGLSYSKEREESFFYYSRAYHFTPAYLITRKQNQSINSIDDIKNKTVYLKESSITHKMIEKNSKTTKIIDKKDIIEMYSSLYYSKDADAIVSYFIDETKLDRYDLKIADTIYDRYGEVSIGINHEYKELNSIIDKAFSAIPSKIQNDIINKPSQIDTKTDWILVGKVSGAILLLLIIVFINNQKLKSLVKEKTQDIQRQNNELENLLDSFDRNVIFTKTDLKGNITHASSAFCEISGYTYEELIGQPHNIVRHPETPKETFIDLWSALKNQSAITLEVKNRRKDGSYYWVEGKFEPDYDSEGNLIGYNAVRQDITAKKVVEELSSNLEKKVLQRTSQLEKTKEQIELILENILLPVLITSKESRKIIYANKFAEKQYEIDLNSMIGSNIDDLYTVKDQNKKVIKQLQENGIVENLEQVYKTTSGKEFTALLSVTPMTYNDEDAYIGMVTDITQQKKIEEQIRQMHKHTRDSIEYASIIQYSLIPEATQFNHFFKDHFTLWNPKDIVGGDIYLFERINEDEAILMVIDCTGHGVPGAFVTMLVKAIERQVIATINNNRYIQISPSWILSYFNKTIKNLLKQESKNATSNAGFDGGILYYNKKEKIIKFSGAYTELFYTDENNEINMIKGDKHSIGYKKSDENYTFKEHIVKANENMQLYLTTDGYLDQNGGEKGFPFGKKRFKQLLKNNLDKDMSIQKESLIEQLNNYQKDEDRNDDITIIGVKI